jgi:PAS domain S-box-containing protein
MIPPLPTPDEKERLSELKRLRILDTPAEEMFDELTRLIADVCETPMAVISLVDGKRQWFKSRVGISATETAREVAFCAHAIHGNELFVVEDATKDERFHDNPLVTGSPHIRFYAGMPLTTENDHNIGMLCALDHQPRQLSPLQRNVLEVIGRQVTRLAEVRRKLILQDNHAVFQSLMLTHAASGIVATNPKGIITHINPAAERMLQYKADELVGKVTPEMFHDATEVAERARALSAELGRPVAPGFEVFVAKLDDGQEETRSWTYRRKDGSTFPVLLSVSRLRDDEGTLVGYLGLSRDITEQKSVESKLLENQSELTKALTKISRQQLMLMDLRLVQGEFINKPDASDAFDHLLALILKYTESEYGFIGEVLRDEADQPYLKSLALTNIAWDEATRKFYDEHAPKGMEFRNLKTLFGHVMTSEQIVIANEAPVDPRRGGLPSGHPPLRAFLGIPIKLGSELVGMIGAANRSGGYSQDLITELEPLIASYGNLIQARRNRILREGAEASLRENEARLQRVIDASGLGYWDWNMLTGEIVFSGAWESMLGYADHEIERSFEAWLRLIHPDDRPRIEHAFNEHVENRINSYAAEFRMRAKDGSWRWILAEGRVIERDAEGRARHMTGIHKDIHYRKVVEDQARQLKETTTLIQEVHHRVKNNLQVISSLLSFQEDHLQPYPELAEKFQVTKSRVAAIASLHELLYRSSYPDKITMTALIGELIPQACAVFGIRPDRIRVEMQVEDVLIHYNQAAPFSLILNELITNAIKHAFPGGSQGLITVTAGEDVAQNRLFLRVADDGVGMPADADPGVNTGSLGMILVERLADQLGGSVQRLPVKRGTTWELSFSRAL